MNDSYCFASSDASRVSPPGVCPQCGATGKPVTVQLLKHQLKAAHLASIKRGDTFYFCASPGCEEVYFSAEDRCFSTADLRQQVTQKASGPDRPLCYCFGFSEGMVREEIAKTGRCTVPERIKTEIAAGHCACEIRNPQGTCCLGNVAAVVHALLVRPN